MAGKGMQAAGQGMQAGGRAMMGAGQALSATGVGAVAGVPLTIAGGGVAAAGAGLQAGGAGMEAAGSAAQAGGRAARGAGAQMEKAGQAAEALAKQIQPGGAIADRITDTLKRFPFLNLINDAFPALFWLMTYIIRSFSFFTIILGLAALPLLWALVSWLAMFGGRFQLPLMPVKLPKVKFFEVVVSTLVALFAISIPTMIILVALCATPGGWLLRQGLAFAADLTFSCGS